MTEHKSFYLYSTEGYTTIENHIIFVVVVVQYEFI